MERFIQFNDENINSFRIMELTDLAKTLTKDADMEVEYGPLSYLDVPNQKVIISHFWDHRGAETEWNGLKSDIFLRSIGSYHFTDVKEVNAFVRKSRTLSIPSFAKQLFMMLEDARIQEKCIQLRRGTREAFRVRREVYSQYFDSQQTVHIVKGVPTDALFNTLYGMLHATSPIEQWPPISPSIDQAYPFIRQQIERAFDARSTKEVAGISFEISEVVDELVQKDMLNEYFHLPEKTMLDWEEGLTFDDLKRKDPLANDDLADDPTGEEEVMDEEFKTWHRESEQKGDSFLQFDLEHGAKSAIKGDAAREGDDGEQALGMVQGASKKTNRRQFDPIEADERTDGEAAKGGDAFGKDNRHAYPVFEEAKQPTDDQTRAYERERKQITTYQKKLQKMIEKTLDHKKILPRTNLAFGRLSKKLTPFFTDEQPKVFYKKDERSPEIDATFTLLLDCSASMYDKMDETKKGLILFHEALKSVRVPHEIVGFWEDTNDASETSQPNYMKTVIGYHDSVHTQNGAAIMQLEPEEDNRDGYAIRHMTQRLRTRKESQRFLLVFSDGEPAAMNYEQNGIMDTHEAVLEARKQGIEVMNIFLATHEIPEAQKDVIRNIYGKYSLFVTNIEELPDVLFPLLKRLLYKSI